MRSNMSRKLISLLLAGALSFGLAAGAGAASVGDFTDVKSSDWYYKAVNHVTHFNYFNGTSATTFSPNTGMDRSMVVTVLARRFAKSLDAYNGKTQFTDVAADAYYAKAVNWAVSLGVTNGTSATTFSPNSPVTREQIATFLYRAAYPGATPSGDKLSYLDKYSDKDTAAAWAKPCLGWASAFAIINGMDGKLAPQGTTTRAMFAQILQNYDTYCGVLIEDPTPTPTPTPTPDPTPEPTPTPGPTPTPAPGTDPDDAQSEEDAFVKEVKELLVAAWKENGSSDVPAFDENLAKAARKISYQEFTDAQEAVSSTDFDKPLGEVYDNDYARKDYIVRAYTVTARTVQEAMNAIRESAGLMDTSWFTNFGIGCKEGAGLLSKNSVTVIVYKGNPKSELQIDKIREDWIKEQQSKPATLDAMEQEVITRLNVIRRENGLPEFSTSEDMQTVAKARAKEMKVMFDEKSNRDNIHFRPDGSDCLTIYKDFNMYPYFYDAVTGTDGDIGRAAETAGSAVKTAEEIVTGWMNSPHHKQVILTKEYVYVGIAYTQRIYNNHPSGYYWALELVSVS